MPSNENEPRDVVRAEFARRVRQRLQSLYQNDFTFAKLAEDTNYPKSTLQSWFGDGATGSHLPYDKLLWWAEYLGESLDMLFGRDAESVTAQAAKASFTPGNDEFDAKRRNLIEETHGWLLIQVTTGTSWRGRLTPIQQILKRRRNNKVYVVMCAPDDEASKKVLARGRDNSNWRTLNDVNLSLNGTLSEFAGLKRDYPGELVIRPVPYIPPYNLYIADPHLKRGKALVIFNNWRGHISETPTIEISRCADRRMFNFFFKQYKELFKWPWEEEKQQDPSLYDC